MKKMAYGGLANYNLVDSKSSLKKSLKKLKTIPTSGLLAVSCVLSGKGRPGEILITTVATEEKAYIFDVAVLKQAVFDEGLREILENKSREKLMFDCREAADDLWHQYGVKLSGIRDIQLLEVMIRRHKTPCKTSVSCQLEGLELVHEFDKCMELYINDKDVQECNENAYKLVQEDRNAWKNRPLSQTLLCHSAVNTLMLFKLYKAISNEELSRLRVASQRYADVFRSKTERSYDDYEINAFLPLGVIPDNESTEMKANVQCFGCGRLFPLEEFTKDDLCTSDQKCRVCVELVYS